ncbi:MAG: DUF2341 domain-containing protein [Candidatus Andersenbacteria bacterium]
MQKNIVQILVLGVMGALLFTLFPAGTRSASWLEDFAYRKSITINNPGGSDLENYQIHLTLHEGSGSDSGSDIYLNDNVLSSFNDIRFTASDGTTLFDYWIESVDSGVATVWVEIDSLPASNDTNIFIYFGNNSADSLSNADATFPFIDYFDENGIDGWVGSSQNEDHEQETGLQTQSVNTSTFVSSPNSADLESYASCFSGPFTGAGSLITASPDLPESDYLLEFHVKREITGLRFPSSGAQHGVVRVNDDEVFNENTSCSGSGCTASSDWSQESVTLEDTAIESLALIGASTDCIDGNVYYDNVRIRSYVADEPEITAASASEALPTTSSSNSSSSQRAEPLPDPVQALLVGGKGSLGNSQTSNVPKIEVEPNEVFTLHVKAPDADQVQSVTLKVAGKTHTLKLDSSDVSNPVFITNLSLSAIGTHSYTIVVDYGSTNRRQKGVIEVKKVIPVVVPTATPSVPAPVAAIVGSLIPVSSVQPSLDEPQEVIELSEETVTQGIPSPAPTTPAPPVLPEIEKPTKSTRSFTILLSGVFNKLQQGARGIVAGTTRIAARMADIHMPFTGKPEHVYQKVVIKLASNDGRPLSGATVTLFSEPKTSLTNNQGEVEFEQVESGKHKLHIQYQGYTSKQSIMLDQAVAEVTIQVTAEFKKDKKLFVF